MSEPQLPSDNEPSPLPPEFATYPRTGDISVEPPGTPEQLIALSKGFAWLLPCFLLSIVVMFFLWGLPGDLRNLTIPPQYGAIVVAAFAYIGCRKVGVGFGWQPYQAVLCALVLGATSPFCVGIFLIAILINSTLNRIFQYGIRRNAVGVFRRSDVIETARRMKERATAMEIKAAQPKG